MRVPALVTLAMCLAPAAHAADLFDLGPLRGSHYDSPGLTAVHGWHGGYAGGFAGFASANFSFDNTTEALIAHMQRFEAVESQHGISRWLQMRDDRSNGKTYGAFAGWNYQMDEAVVGFEVDFTRLRIRGSSADSIARMGILTSNGYTSTVRLVGSSRAELQDYGTIRARAGYTFGSFMPYVTGGLAIGRARVQTDVSLQLFGEAADPAQAAQLPPYGYISYPNVPQPARTDGFAKDVHSIGLTVGLGMDMAVTDNIFLRGEWQYVRFGDFSGTKINLNQVRGAAGVKF